MTATMPDIFGACDPRNPRSYFGRSFHERWAEHDAGQRRIEGLEAIHQLQKRAAMDHTAARRIVL